MISLKIEKTWSRRGFGIWLLNEREGKTFVAKPCELEMVEYGNAFLLPEPTLYFSPEDFYALKRSAVEEMIGAGLESSAVKLAGKLEATERHLKDLQRVAFEFGLFERGICPPPRS